MAAAVSGPVHLVAVLESAPHRPAQLPAVGLSTNGRAAGIPDFFDDEADYDRFVARLVARRRAQGRQRIVVGDPPLAALIRRSNCASATVARVLQDAIALAIAVPLPGQRARTPARSRRATQQRHATADRRKPLARAALRHRGRIHRRSRRAQCRQSRSAWPRHLSSSLPDARTLDPDGALGAFSTILARGTSAHEQLARYDAQPRCGANHIEALRSVVDWLAETTSPAQHAAS